MADNVEGVANLAKVLLQFANSGKLVEAAIALEKAASSKQQNEETKVQSCKKCVIIKQLSYTTVIPYSIGIMHNWAFPAKNITLKPASISLHDNLAVNTVKPKCLQTNSKPFQKVSMEF